MPPIDQERGPRLDPKHIAGFLVHILTASGVVFGLMALLAAHERRWTAVFVWLGAALVVDAVDGPLARALNVGERLPRWSGEILDLVVDFLNYVFVPTFALVLSGMLPQPLALAAAAAILVTSALYFADRRMKTDDDYFRGFPAAWNAIIFYLFVFRPEPAITIAIIALFCAMTFVPVPFLHPFRVRNFRVINVALLLAWALLALVALMYDLSPPYPVAISLFIAGLYFLTAGILRNIKR